MGRELLVTVVLFSAFQFVGEPVGEVGALLEGLGGHTFGLFAQSREFLCGRVLDVVDFVFNCGVMGGSGLFGGFGTFRSWRAMSSLVGVITVVF